MPRSHRPSVASRSLHFHAMAQGISNPRAARRQARRCARCRFWTHVQGQQCDVCRSGITALLIDDAMAQSIYEQRRVQLGQILPVKEDAMVTSTPDDFQPDRVTYTPCTADHRTNMSPALALAVAS
jgi:hypothetical protein